MYKFFFTLFFFILSFKDLFSGDCAVNSDLKVGIIDNSYYDYKYYLYYTLGNYSLINSIDFELDYVNNNYDKFDIIFGEFYDLKKISKNIANESMKIENFYEKNGISIVDNVYPLDLDTLIILSREETNNFSFEELSNFYNSTKYTLGLSFKPLYNFSKLMVYSLNGETNYLNNISLESKLHLLKKSYVNMNKNVLDVNYNDIYNSYNIDENMFTLFDDGILLYENLKYSSFQLFPKSRYNWNFEKGYFDTDKNVNPTSFFGFSAYLNSNNHSGFICYLTEREVRTNAFTKFNLGISPLSSYEIQNIKEKIPEEYLKILDLKNQKIFDYDLDYDEAFYNTLVDIIFDKDNNINIIKSENFLN